MKLSKTHGYHRFITWTKGLFRDNPVLSLGLAIPFAAAAVSSLQTAAALSVGVLITLLPTVLLMSVLGEKIPPLLRLPVCALLASLFLLPTRILVANISVTILDSIGIYFSLLCVSTLLFSEVEWAHGQKDLLAVSLRVLSRWLGFSLVVVLVGVVREILGNGTLWGHPLTWMKIRFSGVLVSGFGFVLLGFLAAMGKKIHRTILYLIPHKDPNIPGFFHLMLERNVPEDKKENPSPNEEYDEPTVHIDAEQDQNDIVEQAPSNEPEAPPSPPKDEVEELLESIAQSRKEEEQTQVQPEPEPELQPEPQPQQEQQPAKPPAQTPKKSKGKKKHGKGKKQR